MVFTLSRFMEIIFNENLCKNIRGRINRYNPWHIEERKGHFYAVYRGDKNCDIKRAFFRDFYRGLRKLQDAKCISKIILTEQERRIIEL